MALVEGTYSKEEIEFIEKNYKDMTIEEMAKKLNRQYGSICYKIKDLGKKVNLKYRRWEEKDYVELERLMDKGLTGRKIAKVMGFSDNTIYRKAMDVNGKVNTDTNKRYIAAFWDLEDISLADDLMLSKGQVRRIRKGLEDEMVRWKYKQEYYGEVI